MNFFRLWVGRYTKKMPLLHRFLILVYHLIIFEVLPRIKDRTFRHRVEKSDDLQNFLSLQKILCLEGPNLNIENIDDVITYLINNDIEFSEGGWTIYLPPNDKLLDMFSGLKAYPKNSGLKILRDLNPPETAHYTPNNLRPTPGAAPVRSRTPNLRELMRVACMLNTSGLGSKVYDLVEIKFGSKKATAYIVEHVEGKETTSDEHYKIFIEKLDNVLNEGILGIAHGDFKRSKDFQSPDCNGNLITEENGKSKYIDFQSFYFRNELLAFNKWVTENSQDILFGPKRFGKGNEYLYQLIPGIGSGKRSTLDRWRKIDDLMENSGISLHESYTFDIGCNSGLMSYYALSRGAMWSFGWDQKNVAVASKNLLNLLGATRWTTIGGDIDSNTNFKKTVCEYNISPEKGVLFYLAISGHIGFPKAVSDLPWKYCIYEGHSNQNISVTIEKIKSSVWSGNFKLLAHDTISDGDSPERCLVVFEREI